MLLELSIRNLAIIDSVSISFAPGLNVLTGETGAGKSIVVDAMNLVLGGRADRDMVQSGAEKAHVEALFAVDGNHSLVDFLSSQGLEAEEGTLLLAREVHAAGRTVCRVGGNMVPLAMLRQVAELLLDMHGQHEHQSLLDTKKHLAFLDSYGGEPHGSLLSEVRIAYHAWHTVSKELAQLRERLSQRSSRLSLLEFQLSELDAAKLRAGEDDELERQRVFYRNAAKITEGLEGAYIALYAGEAGQDSSLDALRKTVDALQPLAKLDIQFEQLHGRMEELYYQLEDASGELRGLRDGLEYDADQAEYVETRLDAIQRLRRKYGATVAEMLDTRQRLAKELEELTDAEETESALVRKCAKAEAELYDKATALHKAREALAVQFENRMRAQLMDLGMQHAVVKVQFSPFPAASEAAVTFHEHGMDEIEFLLAPNLGEPERPLARIASGGELSRIMLAIKSISAEKTGVPSMVFDEIDTGISGRMAQVVAEKMATLSDQHQVICVTHLPQIAAMSDAQFLVQKNERDGKTRTQVLALDDAGRCAELARIIGGADSNSQSSMQHAQTLLNEAAQRKQEIRRG